MALYCSSSVSPPNLTSSYFEACVRKVDLDQLLAVKVISMISLKKFVLIDACNKCHSNNYSLYGTRFFLQSSMATDTTHKNVFAKPGDLGITYVQNNLKIYVYQILSFLCLNHHIIKELESFLENFKLFPKAQGSKLFNGPIKK